MSTTTSPTHVLGVELLKLIIRSKDPFPAKFFCHACHQNFILPITPTSPRPTSCKLCNSKFIEWLLPEDPHQRAARFRDGGIFAPSPPPTPPTPQASEEPEEPMETEPSAPQGEQSGGAAASEVPKPDATPSQKEAKKEPRRRPLTSLNITHPEEPMEEEASAPAQRSEAPSQSQPREDGQREEGQSEQSSSASRLSSQPMVVISAGGEATCPTLTMNLFPSLDEAGPRNEGRKGPIRTVIIQQRRSRNFNYLAQEYMAQIIDGGGSGDGRRPRRGRHQLLVGLTGGAQNVKSDPADFVWGARGLDNVISGLLESISDRGPPPADKKKVDAIPKVTATQEIVQENVDGCTVCKDLFKVDDCLRKLPCKHLFHESCIIPWLKLHDTCPTCRFHVNADGSGSKDANPPPPPESTDSTSADATAAAAADTATAPET